MANRSTVETLLRISEAGETSAYSPALLAELARVWLAVDSAPRGLVEQAWTRKVTHEVTLDVMGGSIEMSGRTYRLVDESRLVPLATAKGESNG